MTTRHLDEDTDLPERYERTRGAANTSGIDFELDFSTYLYFKFGFDETCRLMYLLSNVNSLGLFDDVAVGIRRGEEEFSFVFQLKCREESKREETITFSSLTKRKNDKQSFIELKSLVESTTKVKSFCEEFKMPGKFENCLLGIFTNATNDDTLTLTTLNISEHAHLFNTTGHVNKLDRTELHEDMKNKGCSEELLDEFFSKLYLFTGQCNPLSSATILVREKFPKIDAERLLQSARRKLDELFKVGTPVTLKIFNEQVIESIYEQLHDRHKPRSASASSVKEDLKDVVSSIINGSGVTRLYCTEEEFAMIKNSVPSDIRIMYLHSADIKEYQNELEWYFEHTKGSELETRLVIKLKNGSISEEVYKWTKHTILHYNIAPTREQSDLDTQFIKVTHESGVYYLSKHVSSEDIPEMNLFIQRILLKERKHIPDLDEILNLERSGGSFFLTNLNQKTNNIANNWRLLLHSQVKLDEIEITTYDVANIQSVTENDVPLLTLNISDNQKQFYILQGDHEYKYLEKILYELILEDGVKSFHWFNEVNGKLYWEGTSGPELKLVSYQSDVSDTENVRDVTQLQEQVILLLGEPGMGKTFQLIHWTNYLIHNKKIFVVYVSLTRVQNHLKDVKFDCFDDIVAFITKVQKKRIEGCEQMVRILLQSDDMAALFLDGLDEVLIYEDTILALISCCRKFTKMKVIISSRRNCKLANKIPFYSLKPFTDKDQDEYLHRFCQLEHEKTINIHVLEHFREYLKPKFNKMFGSPFLIHMLAMIYSDGKEKLENEHLTLLNLFEKIVEKKISVHLVDKCGVTDTTDIYERMFHEYLDRLQSSYAKIAAHNLSKPTTDCVQITKKKYNHVGSLQWMGFVTHVEEHQITYVHKLFAEYFAAVYFTNHLAEHQSFIRNQMYKPEFLLVRTFFDLLLAKDSSLITSIISDNDLYEKIKCTPDRMQTDMQSRNILHLACSYGKATEEILPVVMEEVEELINQKDKLLQYTVSEYCLAYCDQLNWICVCIEFGTDLQIKNKLSEKLTNYKLPEVLKTCVDNNLYSLFEEKIEKHRETIIQLDFRLLVKKQLKKSQLLDVHRYRDIGAVSLLDYVAFKGNIKMLEYLLKKFSTGQSVRSLEYEFYFGFILTKSVFFACLGEHRECVNLLMKEGADFETFNTFRGGDRIVHILVANNQLEFLKYLRDEHNLNLNTLTNFGETPLMRASECGHHEMVQFLLQNSVDVNCVDGSDNTALHFACSVKNNLAIVTSLVEHNININRSNKDGLTGLMKAVIKGDTSIVEYLLAKNANITLTDRYGYNAVHYACENTENAKLVELLIEKGVDLNISTKLQQTPLMISCMYRNKSVAQLLVSKKVNLYSCDIDGNNALHCAAKRRDNEEILQILYEVKMDVSVLNSNEKTAYDLAKEKDSYWYDMQNTIKYLQKWRGS